VSAHVHYELAFHPWAKLGRTACKHVVGRTIVSEHQQNGVTSFEELGRVTKGAGSKPFHRLARVHRPVVDRKREARAEEIGSHWQAHQAKSGKTKFHRCDFIRAQAEEQRRIGPVSWSIRHRTLAQNPVNWSFCPLVQKRCRSMVGLKGDWPMNDRSQHRKVNLNERLGSFEETWAPKIVARYNQNEVRLVKTEGEWVWHKHDETDELFLILEGEFEMAFRDQVVVLGPGELLVVPRGVEHRPAARKGLVKLLLIDPDGTPNTGDPATATQAVELS
jgi:mannose-6-phosphate isomerase-like protein (cupin superfamily)